MDSNAVANSLDSSFVVVYICRKKQVGNGIEQTKEKNSSEKQSENEREKEESVEKVAWR